VRENFTTKGTKDYGTKVLLRLAWINAARQTRHTLKNEGDRRQTWRGAVGEATFLLVRIFSWLATRSSGRNRLMCGNPSKSLRPAKIFVRHRDSMFGGGPLPPVQVTKGDSSTRGLCVRLRLRRAGLELLIIRRCCRLLIAESSQ
jgi:hypothetical protein